MKSFSRITRQSLYLTLALVGVAFFSAGCTSSRHTSNQVNPIAAYQTTSPSGQLPTDGQTKNPGAINTPIVSVPLQGDSIDGHQNAPLLDNMHPGWQQTDCLSCHDSSSKNPDHFYTDSSLCYLCHGTNGNPGFSDQTPPSISGVNTSPSIRSAIVSWRTDKECVSRIVVRTVEGDRLEFPVSGTYSTSHRYEVVGLQPATTYYFELINTDKAGNKSSSATIGTFSFTTVSN